MASYEQFADVYDLFMDNVPYASWEKNLRYFFEKYQIPKGLVADLGCGTGQMTRRLAASGYDMIGIDASYDMLSVAMNDGPEGILYLCQDMRAFELYGTVAAIVSVCDSMNYLTSMEDFTEVLRLANNYLDPKGIFVFDLNTYYKYETVLGDKTIAESRDDAAFLWENSFDPTTSLNTYALTLFVRVQEDLFRRSEELHVQRAYTVDEIVEAVDASGMKLLEIVDVATMEKPTEQTERIYVVCQECGKES